MSACLRGEQSKWTLVFILGECVDYREGGTYHLFKGEKTGEEMVGRDGGGPARVGRGQSANEQIS